MRTLRGLGSSEHRPIGNGPFRSYRRRVSCGRPGSQGAENFRELFNLVAEPRSILFGAENELEKFLRLERIRAPELRVGRRPQQRRNAFEMIAVPVGNNDITHMFLYRDLKEVKVIKRSGVS
jgi:hypothetical protein